MTYKLYQGSPKSGAAKCFLAVIAWVHLSEGDASEKGWEPMD